MKVQDLSDNVKLEEAEAEMMTWRTTDSGLKFVDEVVGNGVAPSPESVISLHYTVSFAKSGMVFGTSRGDRPLSFAPGKHDVPIFSEAVEGMRIGGKRRLTIPASKIPPTQAANVPQDHKGEDLRFEIELLRMETGLAALIPSLLPPG